MNIEHQGWFKTFQSYVGRSKIPTLSKYISNVWITFSWSTVAIISLSSSSTMDVSSWLRALAYELSCFNLYFLLYRIWVVWWLGPMLLYFYLYYFCSILSLVASSLFSVWISEISSWRAKYSLLTFSRLMIRDSSFFVFGIFRLFAYDVFFSTLLFL